MKNKKILIIEDDEVIRGLLQDGLKDFTVFVAPGGKEGLEIAYTENPDLIFLDIMMNDVSGIDVMKDFKQKKSELLKRIIVLSNASENTFIAKSLELGVTSFVVKGDFDIKDIIELVNKRLQ